MSLHADEELAHLSEEFFSGFEWRPDAYERLMSAIGEVDGDSSKHGQDDEGD